jgi:hypothetical protein
VFWDLTPGAHRLLVQAKLIGFEVQTAEETSAVWHDVDEAPSPSPCLVPLRFTRSLGQLSRTLIVVVACTRRGPRPPPGAQSWSKRGNPPRGRPSGKIKYS